MKVALGYVTNLLKQAVKEAKCYGHKLNVIFARLKNAEQINHQAVGATKTDTSMSTQQFFYTLSVSLERQYQFRLHYIKVFSNGRRQ